MTWPKKKEWIRGCGTISEQSIVSKTEASQLRAAAGMSLKVKSGGEIEVQSKALMWFEEIHLENERRTRVGQISEREG